MSAKETPAQNDGAENALRSALQGLALTTRVPNSLKWLRVNM